MSNRLVTIAEVAADMDRVAREACAKHGVEPERFFKALRDAMSRKLSSGRKRRRSK